MKKLVRFVILFVFTYLIVSACHGQPGKRPDRSKAIPKVSVLPSQINFTQAWVWEYEDAHGNKGEMTIYHEPKLNCWLFTREAYGNTDDMCDWVLAMPDGEYYFAYQDGEEYGKARLLRQKVNFVRHKEIPVNWGAAIDSTSRRFGDTRLGFPLIKGHLYLLRFEQTQEQCEYYIGLTNTDMTPVYYVNRLDADAKLPVDFPIDLPPGYIALSEKSKYMSLNFKYISHAQYHINLLGYEIRN